MKDLLIRNVDDHIVSRLDDEAQRAGLSRQELLLRILRSRYGEAPAVAGWFRADRNGELTLAPAPDGEEADVCCECGQDLDWVWFAVLTDGSLYGPVCSGCARSD